MNNTINSFKRKILTLEIKHCYWKIKELHEENKTSYNHIISNSPSNIYEEFFNLQHQFFNRNIIATRKRASQKFLRLQQSQMNCCTLNKMNENWISNLTNEEIPLETMLLLSYGPKFCLQTNKNEIPYFQLISEVESMLHSITDKQKQNIARTNIINIIQNYVNGNQKSNSDQVFFDNIYKKTEKFISENNKLGDRKICILSADKGNKTVIVYAKDYEEKMQAIVDDPTTYKQIRNPTLRFMAENNTIVQKLFDCGIIDVRTKFAMKSQTAIPPGTYGAPKIHKIVPQVPPILPDVKYRTILSAMCGPSYKTSQYVSKILKSAVNQEQYNINSSYQFCEFINDQKIPANYVLVSLDVVALFTSVPVDLILQSIRDRWSDFEQHTHIDENFFVKMVEFCLTSSYFQFRDKYYLQTFGAAMGNPTSPSAVDLVMEVLLDSVLEKLAAIFPVPFLRKYVDDLITCIPEDMLDTTLKVFNDFNPHIQFTAELEKHKRLPYLDMVLIHNEDNSITTEWYMKPMASGRLINYNSSHPMSQKLNVCTGLISRIMKLTTNKQPSENAELVKTILRNNNFPATLVNKLLHRYWAKHSRMQTLLPSTQTTATTEKSFKSMVFIPELSDRIAKVFNKEANHITISYSTNKTVRSLFTRLKDKTDKWSQSNVVYSIQCKGCPKKYIGMTTQYLKKRNSQHKSDCKKVVECKQNHLQGDLDRLAMKSALLQHVIDTNHQFNFDATEILDQEREYYKLLFREMLHINNNLNVNKRSDMENLHLAYSGLLQSLKDQKFV